MGERWTANSRPPLAHSLELPYTRKPDEPSKLDIRLWVCGLFKRFMVIFPFPGFLSTSISTWTANHVVPVWQAIADAVSSFVTWLVSGVVYGWHSFALEVSTLWHQFAVGVTHVTAPLASAELWQIVLYWILILVALVGVVGAFVPALPGITLILGAVIIWGLVKGFAGVALALGVAIAAFLLSVAVDYLAGIIGAQRVGASQWGQVGAIVGMVLGFFGLIPALPVGGPIFGILIGTVLGAFVGEFLHRRELEFWPRVKQSFRVGIAIVVGTLVGNLLQGVLAFVAFAVFLYNSWGGVYGG